MSIFCTVETHNSPAGEEACRSVTTALLRCQRVQCSVSPFLQFHTLFHKSLSTVSTECPECDSPWSPRPPSSAPDHLADPCHWSRAAGQSEEGKKLFRLSPSRARARVQSGSPDCVSSVRRPHSSILGAQTRRLIAFILLTAESGGNYVFRSV